jgi:hypothetical protein
MKIPGGNDSAMVVDGQTWPLALTPELFVRLFHGVRAFYVTVSYSAPLDPPSFFGVDGAAEGTMAYDTDDEITFANTFPAPLIIGPVTGTEINSFEEDPPTSGPISVGFFFGICNVDSGTVIATGDSREYVYNPDTGLFYPRICIKSVSGPLTFQNFPIVGSGVQSWPCTILGTTVEIFTQTNPAHLYTSFNLTIEPVAYWEFSGASGPIYDSVTGAELQNPATLED